MNTIQTKCDLFSFTKKSLNMITQIKLISRVLTSTQAIKISHFIVFTNTIGIL